MRVPVPRLKSPLALIEKYGPGTLLAALVLAFCWLAARWTWQFLEPKATAPVQPVQRADPLAAADAIVHARLFGQAASGQPVETGAVTQLNIRLKGVYAAKAGRPAYAIVNTGTPADQPVRAGDEIMPGVKLDSVHPRHILINRGGVLERVNLEEKAATGTVSTGPPGQFRLNVPSPAPGTFNLSRNELATSLQDPRQAANLGRLAPNPGGGMLVEDVPPGSLAEKLGLQQGDVIRSVNGVPLTSQADLPRLYQQFGQAAQIRLEGLRGGRPLQLSYNVQQ